MIDKLKFAYVMAAMVVMNACQEEGIVKQQDAKFPDAEINELRASEADHDLTFYGPAVPFANGVVRAFVTLDMNRTPISIGISLSARILENLPEENVGLALELPKQWNFAPFDHITVGWNPHGHPPPGIYMVPHFDFHFNMMTEAERLLIPGIPPPYFDPAPDAVYIPQGYVQGPGVEAEMGAHWVDVFSPEFNGGQFTKTMVLGTYNTKVVFYEPMVTLDYLQSNQDVSMAIRQPEEYQTPGYHPTSYKVLFEERPSEILIVLDGLVFRE